MNNSINTINYNTRSLINYSDPNLNFEISVVKLPNKINPTLTNKTICK